jgi:hypothetical protein
MGGFMLPEELLYHIGNSNNDELKQKLSTTEPEIVDSQEYETKPNIEVDDTTVKLYSNKLGIDLETAKTKLAENYRKEYEEADPREIATKAMKFLRQLGPKVAGLESREQGIDYRIKAMEMKLISLENEKSQVNGLNADLYRLENQVEDLKKVMAETLRGIIYSKKKKSFWDKLKDLFR